MPSPEQNTIRDARPLPGPGAPDALFAGLDYHLIVAVSGHRDLLPRDMTYLAGPPMVPGNLPTLATLVRDKLGQLLDQAADAGRPGVVVVSPLAEGADCLVAQAALRLQNEGRAIQLRVVLPYTADAYLSERDLVHQQLIRQYIGQAGGYAVLRTDAPAPFDPTRPAHRDYARQAYVGYCLWLASRASAGLVLWDGVDTVQPGGTSDFVRMVIFGEDSSGTLVRPFPTRIQVVHHLITPRRHNPFPLARYFGASAQKLFQPGTAYQWYDLSPVLTTPPPDPAGQWFRRDGFTTVTVPTLLALLLLVTGITGFEQYRGLCSGLGRNFLDSVVRTISLVALGSITLENCAQAVPALLYWARGVGVILSLYTAGVVYLSLLHNARQWVNVLLWRKNYSLVVGLTSHTYALLRDLKTHYKALTVIDPAGNSRHTTVARLLGVNIVTGDPTDEALLRRAYLADAQKIFVMTGDDDLNVRTAHQMDQLLTHPTRHDPDPDADKTDRAWYVEVQEPRKRYLLSQTTQQNDRLHPFALVETMVRRLQVRYPIDRFYQAPHSQFADVVIIGFGPVGQAIVRNTLQLGHFTHGRRVRIHVFATDHRACETDFLERCPYLQPAGPDNGTLRAQLQQQLFPAGTLLFYALPTAETGLLDADFPLYQLFDPAAPASQCLVTVYVCIENPVQAITLLGEVLPRLDHFRHRDRLHQLDPVTDLQVFCHYEIPDEKEVDFMEKKLNERAAYVPVVFFGKFADECSLDAISARREDLLARQVALWYYLLYGGGNNRLNDMGDRLLWPRLANHSLAWLQANYCRILTKKGGSVLRCLADLCWTSLPEKDRASNRRAADHAWVKLRILGWQTTDAAPPADFSVAAYLDNCQQRLHPSRQPGTTPETPLAELAQLEHRRWCAEKMLEGYAPLLDAWPGRRDEVKRMEWKGDRKEKWRQQKLHLDLDLFENLSETEKQKDHDQILGLPYMLLAVGLRLTVAG